MDKTYRSQRRTPTQTSEKIGCYEGSTKIPRAHVEQIISNSRGQTIAAEVLELRENENGIEKCFRTC